jgi:hypothetical protein
MQQGHVQWHVPMVSARRRLRQEECLSPGACDQPEQHNQTPFQKQIKQTNKQKATCTGM